MFLYIDIDAFFASVEQSINPLLIGKPVMVGGLKHERGVVACPSYEARALGVKTGTPLYEAARYYSEQFYTVLQKYSPDVENISQDEACLKIGRIYNKITELAGKLQKEIWQSLLLSTSIGIGPSRVVAKIASEYKKPMGLTIINKDDIKSFLAKLQIRKIPGVGHVTEKILHEMGIRTAGQLAVVPEKYLKTVFGINGLKIASHSRGEDGIPLRDYRVVRSVSRETGFSDDITDRNVLLSHYYYLLGRATNRLRFLSKRAASVRIIFRYADFKTVKAAGRINPPDNDENIIFPIVETIFRRALKRRLGIRFIGVTLSSLKNHTDGETFLNDRIEKNRRLLKSLDQARGKGGYFSIMTGRTLSLSSRYKRWDTGYELRTPGLSQ
jgi:DNA polymerase-4